MLQEFTDWLFGLVVDAFEALFTLITDAFIAVVEMITSVLVALLGAIPVPGFMAQGLQGVFASVPADIMWLVSAFGLLQALAIIGAGFGFRMVRKVVTLFQW